MPAHRSKHLVGRRVIPGLPAGGANGIPVASTTEGVIAYTLR
jgi:hypothetical protein